MLLNNVGRKIFYRLNVCSFIAKQTHDNWQLATSKEHPKNQSNVIELLVELIHCDWAECAAMYTVAMTFAAESIDK